MRRKVSFIRSSAGNERASLSRGYLLHSVHSEITFAISCSLTVALRWSLAGLGKASAWRDSIMSLGPGC
ncbi:unnamed protein product [Gadus morhua 'NCC']